MTCDAVGAFGDGAVAAMEPPNERRDGTNPTGIVAYQLTEPQWSPLAVSGTTAPTTTDYGYLELAAMEPAGERRDDAISEPGPVRS
jgi:hypothetical protein